VIFVFRHAELGEETERGGCTWTAQDTQTMEENTDCC